MTWNGSNPIWPEDDFRTKENVPHLREGFTVSRRGLLVITAAMLVLSGCGVVGLLPPAVGQIFVADQSNHRIVRINDMTGAGWTSFGSTGSGVNQFNVPTGIFVNAGGQIFVADQTNHRIVRINDMTGAGWTTFGSLGSGVNQFADPTGIFVK